MHNEEEEEEENEVEDEDEVRRLARLTLEAAGYRVISAIHGQDAIEKTIHDLKSVDLVLTDIVMPVMGGFRMVETLKEINPNIKVAIIPKSAVFVASAVQADH